MPVFWKDCLKDFRTYTYDIYVYVAEFSNMVILFFSNLEILMPYLVNIFIILMSVISIFKDSVWPIVLVSGFWVLRLFSLFQFFHFLLLFLVWGFDSCFYPVTIVAIWSISSCALDFFFNLNVFSAILSFASFFSCSMLSSSFMLVFQFWSRYRLYHFKSLLPFRSVDFWFCWCFLSHLDFRSAKINTCL